MKKRYVFCLAITFLSACNSEETEYQKTCYKCYFGNQIVLDIKTSYDLDDSKVLLQNEISNKEDDLLYFSYKILDTNSKYNEFISDDEYIISDEDKELLKIEENSTNIVFFCQIPSGYKAYKRDNIQYQVSESSELLLTDNFYTYNSISNIAYCYFDVKKDENISENYLFSFVMKIKKDFYYYDSSMKIRGIISDHAYNS